MTGAVQALAELEAAVLESLRRAEAAVQAVSRQLAGDHRPCRRRSAS